MKLSICIPSYNRGRLAYELVQSLLPLKVKYGDRLEIIVSNNGSTKGIEEYEAISALWDKGIVYHAFSENRFYVGNYNHIIKMSTGDFCLLISDEDRIDEGNLEYYFELLEKCKDTGIIRAATSGFYKNMSPGYFKAGAEAVEKYFLMGNYISGIIYNRHILTNEIIDSLWSKYGDKNIEGSSAYFYYPHMFVDGLLLSKQDFVVDEHVLVIEGSDANDVPLALEAQIKEYATYEQRLDQFYGFMDFIDDSQVSDVIRLSYLKNLILSTTLLLNHVRKEYERIGSDWRNIEELCINGMEERLKSSACRVINQNVSSFIAYAKELLGLKEEIKVDVHGSCVSYWPIQKKDDSGKIIWKLDGIKSNLYFSHINAASCTTAPIKVSPDGYDFDLDRLFKRCLISDLKKDTVQTLLKSDGKWLIIDFYDMTRLQHMYEGGCYTHTCYLENVAPEYAKAISNQICGEFRWIDIPFAELTERIDIYMNSMVQKYGSNIILNRVNISRYCIDESFKLREIETNAKIYGDYQDNEKLRAIEDYILTHWQIHEIDVAKYYLSDLATDKSVLAVHYERDYYRLAGKLIKAIIAGQLDNCDRLDEEGYIYKLTRSGEIYDYLDGAKFPMSTIDAFNKFVAMFSKDEVSAAGAAFAQLYSLTLAEKEFFCSDNYDDNQKQQILMDCLRDILA